MKLCLIAPVPPPYGGVSNWERIVEQALKADPDIELSIINIAANKRSIDGRNIFDRVFYSGYMMLKADWELKKLIRRGKVQHVHMTTSGGLGFYRDILLLKRLRKYNIPTTYHIHFGRSIYYYEAQDRNWEMLLKSINLASNIITIDEKTFELLKQHVKKKNISCINNPIDVEAFKKYNEITVKKIVYVGWIIKSKGIEELLKAFKIFNERHNNEYLLELVGRGQEEYVQYLKNSFACKNVLFSGEKTHDEAMKCIASGEMFILPSYTEGSPNVVLEAMALKKPIVATCVGSIPYMLSKESGFLIEPKNVEDIVRSLDELLYDEEKKQNVAANAYRRAEELFDISQIYQKYKKVWCENK